jgi:hypothetical protein
MTSVEVAKWLGYPLMSKMHEIVYEVKEIFIFKIEESLSSKLLTCWEFHWSKFRAH